jgi:hypothetical protein
VKVERDAEQIQDAQQQNTRHKQSHPQLQLKEISSNASTNSQVAISARDGF